MFSWLAALLGDALITPATAGASRAGMSTRRLDLIPGPVELARRSVALAVLDAILDPDPEFRCHGAAIRPDQEMIATMRDGSGDGYSIVFCAAGTMIRGYRQQPASGKSLPSALDGVSPELALAADMSVADGFLTTFCIWRRAADTTWHVSGGATDASLARDDSDRCLRLLDGQPATYRQWCAAYFEVLVPINAIAQIYATRPITDKLVATLNPDADPDAVREQAAAMGYGRLPQILAGDAPLG